MKPLFCFAFLILISCVDNSNKNQAMDQYVNKEIRDRIKTIHEFNKQHDTLLIDPEAVHRQVDDLILLSKDVENLGASISRSNAYFQEMISRHHLSASDIKMLQAGMHVNDMASAIKQNEMALFNHVLLQVNKEALPLHAAQ